MGDDLLGTGGDSFVLFGGLYCPCFYGFALDVRACVRAGGLACARARACVSVCVCVCECVCVCVCC